MPKAMWRTAVLADSTEVREVDGYLYFSPQTVNWPFLKPIAKTTRCGWKGMATYYDVVVDGAVNEGAAWSYREPTPAAHHIAGWVAFWQGVELG